MITTFSKLLPVILLCLCLAACAPASTEAKSDQARILEPQVPVETLDALVSGNNAFALDLYQSLRTTDGNLFYSPYSISLALAMTYGGARGETEAQMADALHFDLAQADLHAAFNQLDLTLVQSTEAEDEDDSSPCSSNIANAVWAQQDHPFLPEYLDLLALNYGAGIHLADFTTQAEPTRKEINHWISDQTQERIQDILSPGDLDAMTRMVLVNAIYFKADWQVQFDADDTHEAPFTLLDGSQVQVDMMSNTCTCLWGWRNCRRRTLPGGGAAVCRRQRGHGYHRPRPGPVRSLRFRTGLAGAGDHSERDAVEELTLEMPKFTFRSQFALAEQLAGLGMTDAFDPAVADFSGMDGMHDLFISDVIHQAFVAVDEEGTEAAAATVVIMKLTGYAFPGIPIDHRPPVHLPDPRPVQRADPVCWAGAQSGAVRKAQHKGHKGHKGHKEF